MQFLNKYILNHKGVNSMDRKVEIATFAGGCFWCMVKPFDRYDGVEKVVSGWWKMERLGLGRKRMSYSSQQICAIYTEGKRQPPL